MMKLIEFNSLLKFYKLKFLTLIKSVLFISFFQFKFYF